MDDDRHFKGVFRGTCFPSDRKVLRWKGDNDVGVLLCRQNMEIESQRATKASKTTNFELLTANV